MARAKPRRPTKAAKYPRLKCTDSWGAYVYEIAGKEPYDIYCVQIDGVEYHVGYETHHETVYDMGHTYPTSSRRYFVSIKFAGVMIDVHLDELAKKRVKIFAIDYALEKPKPKPRKKKAR